MARKKTPAQKVNDQKENDCPSDDHQGNKKIVEISCPATIGEKRKLESINCNIGNNEENEIILLKKRCVELEDRIVLLEKSCLSIPSDVNIQQFFEDVLPSFSDKNHDDITMTASDLVMGVDSDAVGETDTGSSASNPGNDSNTVSYDCDQREVCHLPLLPIDDKMLSSLKKENTTCTARSIIKFLFPNPPDNFKLSNVDKDVVENIVQVVKIMHPEETTTTATKIRHSMSNYFGSLTYKKKKKLSKSVKKSD
ncbi:unnamed protein product [Adineta ricciae]|uniref:BEN domain-containing protein n=1 Tax=Adineta ricciae TaxID=249248 RepID=A0A815CBL8_ADIRI|nr:unnamed protein product [Adineta ricciae]